MVVLISQCICIPSHHVVHLKYIQFLFVNYTTVNLRRKNKTKQNKKNKAKLQFEKQSLGPPRGTSDVRNDSSSSRLDLPCTWISSLFPILSLPVPGTDSHKIAVSKPQPPALGTQDKTKLLDTKVIKPSP